MGIFIYMISEEYTSYSSICRKWVHFWARSKTTCFWRSANGDSNTTNASSGAV